MERLNAAPDAQDDLIRRYQSGESTTSLADRFGVSLPSVRRVLRSHGVELRPTKRFTDTVRDEILDRYRAGEQMASIARSIGATPPGVQYVIERSGTQLRGPKRCTLWYEAFDEITPESAYWAGFIFADGHVVKESDRQRVVSVGLAEVDYQHLVKLRSFLRSDHAITRTTNGDHAACIYAPTSAYMCDRLLELGRYEGEIADELVTSRDFWRGVVDGDGSLGSYGTRRNSYGPRRDKAVVNVVGSLRLMTAYAGFIGSAGLAKLEPHPHKTIYGVSTSDKSAARIINLLYGNSASPVLDRKAERARQILSQPGATVSGRSSRRYRPAGALAQKGLW